MTKGMQYRLQSRTGDDFGSPVWGDWTEWQWLDANLSWTYVNWHSVRFEFRWHEVSDPPTFTRPLSTYNPFKLSMNSLYGK